MWSVARRPRWIGALLLALALAAGFAALGQWQLSRSVDIADDQGLTETVVPLETVAVPQAPVTADAAYRMVGVTGALVPGDASVVSGRVNGGSTGFWVVGHVVTVEGPSLAVALGWTPTREEAEAAAAASPGLQGPLAYTGRYQPTEPPQEGKFEQGERNTVSVAALVNEWTAVPRGVYGGYLVAAQAPGDLVAIDSPRPSDEVSINWLNIFYAVEWVVFAGFAVFLWYRLVRDAWEREQDEAGEVN